MVFHLDRASNRLVRLDETTFSDEKIFELKHIEEWVRKNPDLLCDSGEQIKIISKQQMYQTLKRSDLIAVDSHGQIVIIELKRDVAKPMDEFQAIRYASAYLDLTYNQVCQIYARYLEQNKEEFGLDQGTDFLGKACNETENFCGQDGFNRNQRIILVSKEFSPDLLSAVTWLILKGIDIKCIALTPYKHNEELFIVPRVLLPTPEISENIVRVRQAEDEVRQEKQRATYRTWEGNIDAHYDRLRPPLGDYLGRLISDLGMSPSNLSGSGFHLVNGDRKIMVTTWVKSKIELRFPKTTKEDLEALLKTLKITSLTVKEKSDIEPYGLANPTPSIDYKEGHADFQDVTRLCKEWLGVN